MEELLEGWRDIWVGSDLGSFTRLCEAWLGGISSRVDWGILSRVTACRVEELLEGGGWGGIRIFAWSRGESEATCGREGDTPVLAGVLVFLVMWSSVLREGGDIVRDGFFLFLFGVGASLLGRSSQNLILT